MLAAALRRLDTRISSRAGTVTVFNPSSWDRADLVTVTVAFSAPGSFGLKVLDPRGQPLPFLVESPTRHPDGSLASAQVTVPGTAPALGYRAGWEIRPTVAAMDIGWTEVPGEPVIESNALRVRVDRARGGTVSTLVDKRTGRSLLRPGAVGNELLLEQEYPEHPKFHEGPWHLVPTGRVTGSAEAPAESVVVTHCALGERITVTGRLGGFRYTQRLTLWHGSDRLDCRTTLDGFAGADQLVRVRWPVDVPGGLPVSEVGNAVVGRGFAVLGQDSAEHPWTLDNPANAWFAVSATARVRIGGTERAIGIAELVAPDDDPGDATRALAIALAGQGVTATSSRGTGPRYGRLTVDSNLPDVRIALGGPQDNDFTAAVLANAAPEYRLELEKQLTSGAARVWVPASRPLSEVWQPSADLTAVDSLPVLILVGDLDSVVEDLADAVIEVGQTANAVTPGEPGLLDYTVGLVNTGMPGFAVDTSGALHLSLLRSCTGWPSGVWINPPRRTAPDGSNFQQQHWSQRFDYSLVAGPGDWRAAGLVRAGHDVNHPLYATVHEDSAGELPAEHSFVQVDAPLVLTALKPRGNPLASGRSPGLTGLTARVYESLGQGGPVTIRTSWPTTPQRLDLLEQPIDADLTLAPMEIATIALDLPPVAEGTAELGAETEPHQPVYTRYWLHNTGPAPVGNLPVAVHLEPQVVTGPIELSLTVASDRTDADSAGSVELVLPDGWTTDHPAVPYRLSPGDHQHTELHVVPAADAPDGTYWIRAQSLISGQVVEDVSRVIIGNAGAELDTTLLTSALTARPGDTTEIVVRLTNSARTPVSAQAQLISPWHLWPALPDWNRGAEIPPDRSVEVRFPVTVPPGAVPGAWWALVKIACAGVLYYTETIPVIIDD